MIHALLDTTQIIGHTQHEGSPHEVCAEAIANHDRRSNQLSVTLRAFLRATTQDHISEVTTPDWLPATQTVNEHVDAEEAHEMAKDIFTRWSHKLAASLPN